MLKFTYLAQLGLAGTVLVPAVALKQDPAGGLTEALANTRTSIESLERLHTSLTSGDYGKVETTLDATETPARDARESDEHLTYLREEVSRLQMRWDALEAAISAKGSTPPVDGPFPATPKASTPPVAEPFPVPPTTGLDQGARAELVQRLAAQEAPITTPTQREKISYEPSGFTAHRVRHGRAYYKAGRYEEALSHLAQAKEQAGARFWIACSLEKLGRSDEAIVAYEDVMLSPLDTEYAEHAERNREFLVWKRDFNARITTATAVIKPGVNE